MSSRDSKKDSQLSPATVAVHGGESEDQPFGAIVSPVFHSSTYSFKSFAEMRSYARGEMPDEYFYSRYANPTVAEVERKIAALEGAEACVVTSSGSAATFAALAAVCGAGDEVIACDSIYGGTIKILTEVFSRFSIHSRFIGLEEIPELPNLIGEHTKVFWFETPTNPNNRLVSLEQAAQAAQAAGLFSIVDNTFATPILQQPLSKGIDAVVHSATKYLGGHSDLTAGAVAGRREYIDRVRRINLRVGSTLDPAAAYLLARGIKTLDVRVKTACENALQLATALRGHPKVAHVFYPGLEDDPQHQLAKLQMKAFGGIVAIDLAGTDDDAEGNERAAERFFDALRLVRCAPSLGGVESLVSYPLYSSHYGFSPEQLRAAGVSAATIRIAVGIEAAPDIIADVTQALERV